MHKVCMLLPASPPASTGLIAHPDSSFPGLPACCLCIINVLTELQSCLMVPIPNSNTSRPSALQPLQNTVQASSRASQEHLLLLAPSQISCSPSAPVQCQVLKTFLHGSDLVSACHPGSLARQSRTLLQRKPPSHTNPQGAQGTHRVPSMPS